MGCFGYICKGCGTPINGNALSGGEKCVMIHVRHGKEIGRVEGHYDEYGRVVEQENLPESDRYRGNCSGPNGHAAICDSEFSLDDSYYRLSGLRVYRQREVTYSQFSTVAKNELYAIYNKTKAERIFEKMESGGILESKYAALPVPTREHYSGTVAWHSYCYNMASTEAKANLTPSETDSNQSWGQNRKKYK